MNAKIVKLSEIARIVPGLSNKGAIAHDPDGSHQVVMGKHLKPGEPYYYEPTHTLKIAIDRPVEKYLLEVDDILFMSRGASNYPVVLKDFPMPAVAPSTFYIIRAHKGIDPDYLAWAMCQEPFQLQLNEIRAGSGTLMVSRNGFEELTIPVPPIETQKKIAQLGELMHRERMLRQELLKETERVQWALGRKILNSLTDSK